MTIDETPSAYHYPLLLKQLLQSGLRTSPEQEIVYRDLVRYDYRTLAARVARLADSLAQSGVRQGDTVGVLDWDSHRYLESYFAVPGIGAVLHMVNIRLSPEQILYTIQHAEDDVLFVHADFIPVLESIWDRITRVRLVVVMSDDGVIPSSSLPIACEYEALIDAGSPDYAFLDLDENSRATTFYTTGTTGLPKGVSFSHRQLVLHTLAVAGTLGTVPGRAHFNRADIYMPITPMFHVHAWGIPFVATMLGIKQVYPGRYDPDMLLNLVKAEGVTFSHCVPTLLHMILSKPAAASVDLRNWRVIVGGSALPKALAEAAMARGIDIVVGYGMSETCPIMAIAQVPADLLEADSATQVGFRTRAGLPIPLVDLRIVDEQMTPQPHDGKTVGEIVVRAPWLTNGYFRDPRNSEALWRGGWLHTGDIGHINPDGTLEITDRIKDVIKTGGEWISSLEIEDILAQHPAVDEVAVIAEPDAKWGERPVAIVVIGNGHGDISDTELQAHVTAFAAQGVISKWAVPGRILFAPALEKTSVGKLDKKLLRSRYLNI